MTHNTPGVLGRIGSGITRLRNFFVNALFLLILLALVAGLVVSCQSVNVPSNSALIINPRGVIVEAAALPNPVQELLTTGPRVAEAELSAILRAIDAGARDKDIRMIVLDLNELAAAAPAHAQRIGQALKKFKEAGKKVVSYGNYYSQAQYHIASFADALYMHPMGQVVFEGFGGFGFYFNELLENFDVNVHVYRVGRYKAAVEPLLRNDMSQEARMASEALYQNIWQHMIGDIAANRMLETSDVQDYADHLAQRLSITEGDMARAALEAHLVDELMTADQANVRIAADVGYRGDSKIDINGIDYQSYLAARNLLHPDLAIGGNKIAVIVAQGMILAQSTNDRTTGADRTIELIRRARQDPSIAAVVLRVDSPGGSQLASELIRQELELLQVSGKPVVASFGATAASGGYWIASTADAIVAEPTTITGSIGIFSYTVTFEDTLARYGVHTDGVGTTSVTGDGIFTGISEPMAEVMQARVEQGYQQFLTLVARGRGMTLEQVSDIAEGRVWAGDVAMDLGLVDRLGGLRDALEQAADLAGLDKWTMVRLRPPIDPRAALIAELIAPQGRQAASRISMTERFTGALRTLDRFDDPNHVYALCEPCLGLGAQLSPYFSQ